MAAMQVTLKHFQTEWLIFTLQICVTAPVLCTKASFPKFSDLLFLSLLSKHVTHRARTAAVGTADMWQAGDEDKFFKNPNMRGDGQMERRIAGFLKT